VRVVGLDLVSCDFLPGDAGNVLSGLAEALGLVTTIAGVALSNAPLAVIGTAVSVYSALSLLKCYDYPFERFAGRVTQELGGNFINSIISGFLK
jgi:hypothetical protein